MVDGTALEMRRTCKGSVGSNPTLSAREYKYSNIFSYLVKIQVPTPKPTPKAQIAATKLAAISLSRDPAS